MITSEKPSLNRPPVIEGAQAIFVYHMRKAGGTSLRRYCKKLSSAKSLDYHVVEGYSLDYEQFFRPDKKTLHITSLREPLARIKSLYCFEGRWSQKEKDRSAANAKPFAVWIRETSQRHGSKPNFLWTCPTNYYVKALIGYPRSGKDSIGQAEFDLAKRRLESFEIVLITEWLNKPETARYLQHELKYDAVIPHVRITSPIALSPKDSETHLFDPSSLQALEEANVWDNKLYDFAKQLGRDRIGIAEQHPSREQLLDEVRDLRRRVEILKARTSR